MSRFNICTWSRHAAAAIALFSMFCPAASGQDWPALRGLSGTGVIDPHGILSQSPSLQLKIRWKKKIGSGYSSVVVDRGRLITLYTSGADDVIECFDAQDGRSIWREKIDAKFPGENGSFDGPLATPITYQGRVYGLTPRGKVFCRSLDDGREIWSHDLLTEEKSVQPLYGFVTSPIIAGGNLIVQAGAKDKALAALDLKDGHTVWAVGNDEINSQSPVRMVFEGKEMILAAGGKKFMGVDAATGKILFECEHGGGNGMSMVPVVLDDQTVLLTLDDSFSKAFSITATGDTISASEKWKDRSIKNTYNVPAFVGDWVYAFSTRFLTCVDPNTGAAKWKDRNPGDGFLIAVDGKLILSTKTGSLHIAEASPEGYRELAKSQVFDDLVWSIPAYSNNAIYQRSLGEIACVDVIAGQGAPLAAGKSDVPLGEKFAAFLAKVNSAADSSAKQKIADEFLASQTSFPIVEGDVAHFVYGGPASDVALAGDMFGARQEQAMTRIAGTDVYYYAMQFPRDQRVNYALFVDYQPKLDPRNPRQSRSSMYAGEMEFAIRLASEPPLEMNWFAMPDWKTSEWDSKLAEGTKAELTTEKLTSEVMKEEVVFDVVLPPSYAAEAPGKRYPVIYVMDGPGAKDFGRLPEIAQLVYRQGNREAILVLVNSMAGGPFGGQQFGDVLTKEIVPLIDSKYATVADRKGRSMWGLGFTCEAAVGVWMNHADLFGAMALQSPLVFDQARAEAAKLIAEIKQPTRIYIEWGRYDMFNPHENWDLRTIAKGLQDSLQGNAQVQVSGGMVNDSTDWSSWQNRFEPVLKFLVGD